MRADPEWGVNVCGVPYRVIPCKVDPLSLGWLESEAERTGMPIEMAATNLLRMACAQEIALNPTIEQAVEQYSPECACLYRYSLSREGEPEAICYEHFWGRILQAVVNNPVVFHVPAQFECDYSSQQLNLLWSLQQRLMEGKPWKGGWVNE